MYTEALWELHEALFEATKDYLTKSKFNSQEIKDYIYELSKFSYNRKFKFSNFTEKLNGNFKYDITKAAKLNFKVNPSEIKFKKSSREIEFYYSNSDIDEIKYAIKSFIILGANKFNSENFENIIPRIKDKIPEGQLNYNLGKFFHQANMTVLKRKYAYQ